VDSPRVLVCGDVINDVVVRPLADPVPGGDTPAVISVRPGGSAANQAAWLGHLGADAVFAGRTGAADAEFHRRELSRCGVTPFVTADHDAHTGQIVVLVEPDGERTMITDRGANARLSEIDVPPRLFDGVDLLLLSGYLFAAPGPRAVARSLIATASERGIRFAIDPGSVASRAFLSWTAGAAVCFPNHAEAAALTGETDPETAATSLLRWYDVAVVKLGPDGALVATADRSSSSDHPSRSGSRPRHIPAAPIASQGPIDSTGAGDAFCAGFLSAWLAGADPFDATGAAAALAATALTLPGGRPP
jgi:sugar/nucleoside kinase (ribokinase family)